MKFLSCLLLLMASQLVLHAQNQECMEMIINQPLQFDFNDIAELQQGKVIKNAVEIRINRTSQELLYIYAGISFTGLRIPTELRKAISLRLSYTNNIRSNAVRLPVKLSQTPGLLFTDTPVRSKEGTRSYVFDIIFDPLKQAPVADCSFTINASLIR